LASSLAEGGRLRARKEDKMADTQQKPKFKVGHAVKYQGKLWKVSEVRSDLHPVRYLLDPTTTAGAVTATEDKLEAWKNV
jgi:hypothetical protein